DAKSNSATRQTIRLGLVQWQMRAFKDIEEFYDQVEFFVDTVSDYGTDCIMFPELFNTPLMSPYNDLRGRAAMEKLADLTDEIIDKMQQLAVSYNVNIIAGCMPIVESKKLYNASYLCHRNGKLDVHKKIHITPNELKYYGMVCGNEINVFDTDCGKVGLLICYDVQFHAVSRIMADQGMQMLFVPFMT